MKMIPGQNQIYPRLRLRWQFPVALGNLERDNHPKGVEESPPGDQCQIERMVLIKSDSYRLSSDKK